MAGIFNLTVNERLVKIAVLSEFMHKTLFTWRWRRGKICVFVERLWALARHHFQLRGMKRQPLPNVVRQPQLAESSS